MYVTLCPEQIAVGPVIVPTVPTFALGSTVIAKQFAALDPQALLSDTQTVPDADPNVIVTDRVPCPAVMLAVAGIDQL